MMVLYDGDCGFCRWVAAWALGRDARHVLAFAPIQSPAGSEALADIDPAARTRSVHVVHEDGRRESGGAAMRAVLAALPSARGAARIAALWPWATDRAYAFVARNRRHFGRLVPSAARRRADMALAVHVASATAAGTTPQGQPPGTGESPGVCDDSSWQSC